MNRIHFFKGKTRLGIRYIPFGQKDYAFGVEDAPDAILTKSFLSKFKNVSISSYIFPKPEALGKQKYLEKVFTESIKFKKFLEENLKKDEIQVTIGGDHSITYSSTLVDVKKYGNNIGFIHFDSHADLNLYKKSPSKNFHGMYLRIFIDDFDLPYFDKSVPNKIPLNNLLFVGDLELDKEEANYFKKNNLNIISSEIFRNSKKETLLKFDKFISDFNHVHISFDIDVFERKLVQATGTPSRKGFKKDEIFTLLEIIKNNKKGISIDLAEFNPWKIGAKKSLQISQEVLEKLLI